MNLPQNNVTDFKPVQHERLYYSDKTMYLPLLEQEGSYLVMLRPNGFGKSMFLSMMDSYYNLNAKAYFNELFGELWIGKHCTPLANRYLVLRFDFSKIRIDQEVEGHENIENTLNSYCCKILDQFIQEYKNYFPEIARRKVLSTNIASSKLDIITLAAQSHGYPLYLMIDNYDSPVETVLALDTRETNKYLSRLNALYCRFFKLCKGFFERIILFGKIPLRFVDLAGDINFTSDISLLPDFNSMLGINETEFRHLLQIYKEEGKIEGASEEILAEKLSLYGNYCFSPESSKEESVFNFESALSHVNNLLINFNSKDLPLDTGHINIGSPAFELPEYLMQVNQDGDFFSLLQSIAQRGYIDMRLNSSFSCQDVLQGDNLLSLLYYEGLLTIGENDGVVYRLVIPNEFIRHHYWSSFL